MQASEGQQIKLQEDQIESLRRILDEQKRRVASMRVTSPEAGQLQSARQSAARARPVRQRRHAARPRRSAGPAQGGAPRSGEPGEGRRARTSPATIDLHNNTIVKGHVMRTDPSSVAGHGHGRSRDRRSAARRHALRPRGRRHDRARAPATTCCSSAARASVRPRASVGIFKVDPKQGRSDARHRSTRPRLGEHDRSEEWPRGRRQRHHLRHVAVRQHQPRSNQVARRTFTLARPVSQSTSASEPIHMATESTSSSPAAFSASTGEQPGR